MVVGANFLASYASLRPWIDVYALSRIPCGPPNKCDMAIEIVWKLEVPFKIKVFGWRLFVNRLSTIDLLMYRGIN